MNVITVKVALVGLAGVLFNELNLQSLCEIDHRIIADCRSIIEGAVVSTLLA